MSGVARALVAAAIFISCLGVLGGGCDDISQRRPEYGQLVDIGADLRG